MFDLLVSGVIKVFISWDGGQARPGRRLVGNLFTRMSGSVKDEKGHRGDCSTWTQKGLFDVSHIQNSICFYRVGFFFLIIFLFA